MMCRGNTSPLSSLSGSMTGPMCIYKISQWVPIKKKGLFCLLGLGCHDKRITHCQPLSTHTFTTRRGSYPADHLSSICSVSEKHRAGSCRHHWALRRYATESITVTSSVSLSEEMWWKKEHITASCNWEALTTHRSLWTAACGVAINITLSYENDRDMKNMCHWKTQFVIRR